MCKFYTSSFYYYYLFLNSSAGFKKDQRINTVGRVRILLSVISQTTTFGVVLQGWAGNEPRFDSFIRSDSGFKTRLQTNYTFGVKEQDKWQ
ncbi:MAG: hypothetical protein ACRCX4_01430 [Bacteroidales bacterium]